MKEKLSVKVKKTITNLSELPIDIVMNLPKITVIPPYQVTLTNHRDMISFTDEEIKVDTSSGIVTIKGEHLSISSISADSLVIDGKVESFDIKLRRSENVDY